MPSDRLQECIGAGSVTALFALLQDWPAQKLTCLLSDIEIFSVAENSEIEKAWEGDAFQPDVFFDASKSALIDEARDKAKINVLAVCSEIASVAMYYLRAKGE